MNQELSQSDYEESNYEESSQEELIEEYRDIDGYPNYEVSNLGQVRNKTTGRILKQRNRCNGYLAVNLCQNKIKKTYYIHQLVSKAFIENPDNYSEIDHCDGVKSNNNVWNLRWVSRRENLKNKNGHGDKFVFVNELPDDVNEVQYYSGYFFEGYYWSETMNKLYFNNGVRIREVRPVIQNENYYCNCKNKQNDRVLLSMLKLQKGLYNNQ
ncbi:putative_intron encoded HNH endonuclease [Hexamita inflata]|uniref:Intron encoded HNH endonuclease n=1 Tax=Hexamita inflata TaxID=28002 RepID=A0AA86Q1H1_9EUKA|nr:putative intron encoded HNH endonuclease [Hexamita inflata]